MENNKKETVTDLLLKSDDAQGDVIKQTAQDMKTVPTVESILSKPTNIIATEDRLMTNEVKVKNFRFKNLTEKQQLSIRQDNVHGFYKQICHNLTIGAKALYLVTRDLKQASLSLQADEYEVLKKTLPISESTISKYITIAESPICRKLYIQGKLPEGWTTMYEIAKVEDQDDKDKILKNVNINTTADDVKSLLGKVVTKVKKAFTSMFNFNSLNTPKDFIKVAVESNKEIGSIDPNALLIIKEKVEKAVASAMSEYKDTLKSSDYQLDLDFTSEVVADDSMINTSKEKVLKYFKKYKLNMFLSHFNDKFNELTGVQLTQSTK